MIQAKHFDRKTAPLKYNNLLRFFVLPLNCLSVISTLFGEDMRLYGSFVDVIFCTALIVFLAAACYGLIKWKPIGWYSVHIAAAINIVYNIYYILLSVSVYPTLTGSYIKDTIVSIVYLGIIYVYYGKRKPLYFNYTQTAPADAFQDITAAPIDKDTTLCEDDTEKEIVEDVIITQEDIIEVEEVEPAQACISYNFCPSCGTKILENAKFCHNCGHPNR